MTLNFMVVQSCCHKMGNKKLVVVQEPKSFNNAKMHCESEFSGSLVIADVSSGSYEDLHILGGIAPPDGAWIGLQLTGTTWKWIDESGSVDEFDSKLWGYGARKGGRCAMIDGRGSLTNVDDANCDEQRAFICDVSGGPFVCEAAMKPTTTTTTAAPTTAAPTTASATTTTAASNQTAAPPTTTPTPATGNATRREMHLSVCAMSDFAGSVAADKVESVATCQVWYPPVSVSFGGLDGTQALGMVSASPARCEFCVAVSRPSPRPSCRGLATGRRARRSTATPIRR